MHVVIWTAAGNFYATSTRHVVEIIPAVQVRPVPGAQRWIKGLMTPVLEDLAINAAFALVFSAFIMLLFLVFVGRVLAFVSPPTEYNSPPGPVTSTRASEAQLRSETGSS